MRNDIILKVNIMENTETVIDSVAKVKKELDDLLRLMTDIENLELDGKNKAANRKACIFSDNMVDCVNELVNLYNMLTMV